MSHFCLLQDVDSYLADPYSLLEDAEARTYWLDLFETHFQATLGHAAVAYGKSAGKHIEGARRDFAEQMAQLRSRPDALDGKLSVLALCRMRKDFLWTHRLFDPFSSSSAGRTSCRSPSTATLRASCTRLGPPVDGWTSSRPSSPAIYSISARRKL